MHQAPFVAHFTFITKGSTRFERLRYAQKRSVIFYGGLQDIVEIDTATPGGSQNALYWLHDFTNIMPGVQIKPQFGETPAQFSITGFYEVDAPSLQPYNNGHLFFANRAVIGPTDSHLMGAVAEPTTTFTTEVATLKSLLDVEVDKMNTFYPDLNMRMFRLVYKGVVFGDRGRTFPN